MEVEQQLECKDELINTLQKQNQSLAARLNVAQHANNNSNNTTSSHDTTYQHFTDTNGQQNCSQYNHEGNSLSATCCNAASTTASTLSEQQQHHFTPSVHPLLTTDRVTVSTALSHSNKYAADLDIANRHPTSSAANNPFYTEQSIIARSASHDFLTTPVITGKSQPQMPLASTAKSGTIGSILNTAFTASSAASSNSERNNNTSYMPASGSALSTLSSPSCSSNNNVGISSTVPSLQRNKDQHQQLSQR